MSDKQFTEKQLISLAATAAILIVITSVLFIIAVSI